MQIPIEALKIVASIALCVIAIKASLIVKFSENEKIATQRINALFWYSILIVCLVSTVYSLINEFTLTAPLDRVSLAKILWYSFSLFAFLVAVYVSRIVGILESLGCINKRLDK